MSDEALVKPTADAEEASPINQSGVIGYEELYVGPLPHPQILAHYENVHPGAADRIITMAENQASHRQTMENLVVKSTVGDSRLGVWLAFILVILVIVGGVLVAIFGNSVAGVAICVSGVGGIVGSFIYGTRANRNIKE